ncbi:MAG: hypothetical protein HQ582_04840, partial [Planctomycetes bacterium]|nr:hypothetical protein [Planctomycetota bacterium]
MHQFSENSRRGWRLAAAWAIALVGCLGGGLAAGEADANDRPNILFAFADDWGRYA